MARSVGLEVHKRSIEVCALDDAGKVVFRGRTGCLREELERFARDRPGRDDRVVLEATTNTWAVVEILRPFVAEVAVGNPLKIRAIAEARVKTDKVDALVLAQLLRCDYLPAVWQPDEGTQRLRGLMTHRTGLMTQRSRAKDHVQCQLARLLIHPPCKVLWTKAGLAWLEAPELPAQERLMLEGGLRQLEAVGGELARIDAQPAGIARQEPRVGLLMTMAGVNDVVALGLLASLGDVGRFRDGDHAASYLGPVPTTRQSGWRCSHGRITKEGGAQARGLLTRAARHVAGHPGPLGASFRRLAGRKRRQVAITAVARKLVTVAYLMLKDQEPYRYARPEPTRKKLSDLHRRGLDPADGRRPTRTRGAAVAGLAEVYRDAGLPPVKAPEDLPAGERRMLEARDLAGFARELYRPSGTPDGG